MSPMPPNHVPAGARAMKFADLGERDRAIVRQTMNGLGTGDIAKLIGTTRQSVSSALSRIAEYLDIYREPYETTGDAVRRYARQHELYAQLAIPDPSPRSPSLSRDHGDAPETAQADAAPSFSINGED